MYIKQLIHVKTLYQIKCNTVFICVGDLLPVGTSISIIMMFVKIVRLSILCRTYSIFKLFLSLQKFIGVWTPGKALLYCIACPVGPSFKIGIFEPVSLYADPKFVRAWPGGIGEFKMGA